MGTIADAFACIERWMRANGAETIVENLAAGANEEALAEAEARLGYPLPSSLRELWSVHDGQKAELDGFYETFDLLSSREAHDDSIALFVTWSTSSPRSLATSGLSPEEIASKRWLVLASRDSDGVALNVDTGRVFAVAHDDSPNLTLLAPSVEAWLATYARDVAQDDYTVEGGFGEVYLSRRDRAREAYEDEVERRRSAEAARRAAMSTGALMDEARERQNDTMATEALARATAEERDAVMESLFRADAAFVATVLRAELRTLDLTRAQWRRIEEGGEKLGNAAIVAYAKKMAAG